jgi:phosphoglycolate phosphatase-like HAD superfamily hydrolase
MPSIQHCGGGNNTSRMRHKEARLKRVQNTARQGVIWDMDGVLVDTGEFHFQAWSQALSEQGIPFSRELFRTTFGMNNAGILEVLLGRTPPPELLAEISDRKEHLFRQAAQGHAQPLPGVLAWLERLKAAGTRQAIASSAPPANIDALVDELSLRGYFDAIASGFDLPGKPNTVPQSRTPDRCPARALCRRRRRDSWCGGCETGRHEMHRRDNHESGARLEISGRCGRTSGHPTPGHVRLLAVRDLSPAGEYRRGPVNGADLRPRSRSYLHYHRTNVKYIGVC